MKIQTYYRKHLIITLDNAKDTFAFSDPHFDHENIIRYCNRPFASADEMNVQLLSNYKSVVADGSLVFDLGDMAFGRESRTPKFWLSQLNGRIICFKGSHDHGIHMDSIGLNAIEICTSAELIVNNHHLYLLHDPDDIPIGWNDWVVHGHKHNTVPLIDRTNKRICISMENINYTPISLEKIIEHIDNQQ